MSILNKIKKVKVGEMVEVSPIEFKEIIQNTKPHEVDNDMNNKVKEFVTENHLVEPTQPPEVSVSDHDVDVEPVKFIEDDSYIHDLRLNIIDRVSKLGNSVNHTANLIINEAKKIEEYVMNGSVDDGATNA